MINSEVAAGLIEGVDSESWEQKGRLSPALLDRIYEAYFPRIYNYLSYRTTSQQEAEDLVGLVFERVISHYRSFDPRRGAFEGWIFTIARNVLLNHKRSHYRHPESELTEWLEGDETLSPDQLFLKHEELDRLRHYLTQLNERDRELIALRYGAGLSQKRVGELMKLNETAVAVALGRAVRRLRLMFENEDTLEVNGKEPEKKSKNKHKSRNKGHE